MIVQHPVAADAGLEVPGPEVAVGQRHRDRPGENRQNRRAKLIQKYDLDGDGNLGPGELPPRVQQKLRRFDRNGDGWLDQGDQAGQRGPRGPRER